MTPEPAGKTRSRFQGCLLGGAVGDAMGASVEFLSRATIDARFGPGGIRDYAPAYGGIGRITDDTQMTLFTAEGLLRGFVREVNRGNCGYSGVVGHAYLRWLQTQGERPAVDMAAGDLEPGWLLGHRQLHDRRAPGNTCVSALLAMHSYAQPANNDSKGCGGVMRVAPVGLFDLGNSPEYAFNLATEVAALTHGHPTGSLTAGAFAVLVQSLAEGNALEAALELAKLHLRSRAGHEETLLAIEKAEELARLGVAADTAIPQLGAGWVAEEALAISIYCALIASDFRDGIVLAVNHGGDSDSTGAITGNLLGAALGIQAIPPEWLEPLELRDVIAEMADDLMDFRQWDASEDRIWKKYPGF